MEVVYIVHTVELIDCNCILKDTIASPSMRISISLVARLIWLMD